MSPLAAQERTDAAESLRWRIVVARSVLAQCAALFIAVFSVFATSRLIIAEAGPTVFGFVMLVGSFAAMLPFLDMGTGASVTNAVAESKCPADDDRVRRTILTSSRVLIASAAVIIIACFVMALLDVWPDILGGRPSEQPARIVAATVVSMTAFALSLPLGNASRILLGYGRNDWAVVSRGIVAPATLLLVLFISKLEVAPGWFAVAPAAAMLMATFFAAVVSKKVTNISLLLPLRTILAPGANPGESIRRVALPMMVITIGLPLGLQTDRLMLAHVSSTQELAQYSLASQIYTPFWSILATAGMALWPVFAKRRSQTQPSLKLLIRSVSASTTLGVVGGMAIVAAGPATAHLVSDGAVQVDRLTATAFAALLIVQAGHLPSGMYLTDPAGLRLQAVSVVAMVFANLPLSWWLATQLGAAGPVIGSALSIGVFQWMVCFAAAIRRAQDESKAWTQE